MKKTLAILTICIPFIFGCTTDKEKFKSNVPTQEVHTTQNINEKIPESLNLDVQFYSQAPFKNWDMPYQEACEEASLILAHNYITGTTMTIKEFDQAIIGMVEWQKEYFGSHKDLTIEETSQIATKYLKYPHFEILDNPTPKQIRTILTKGNPIVAPFAGRHLGNPFFSNEGPIYHMLVIKGYEKDGSFITNDVGTRRGENFVYDENTLMNALHDWVQGSKKDPEKILTGKKTILVLKQPE